MYNLQLILTVDSFMSYTMSIRHSIIAAISLGSAVIHANPSPAHNQPLAFRCTAHNASCWPSASEWSAFNHSIAGRLIDSHPAAAVCHAPLYNEGECVVARQNWTNSFWRTAQPGAYSAILWEEGNQVCSINGTATSPCGQGRGRLFPLYVVLKSATYRFAVAEYSVAVNETSDIQKAIKFASEKSLYLVIKNTGHDQYAPIPTGCRSR
jgi:hypothetical protein